MTTDGIDMLTKPAIFSPRPLGPWWRRALGLALLVLAGSAAEAAELTVNDIRIGVYGQGTRFVVDLSGPAEPRVFGLADPYRIVIDMPEADFDLANEVGQRSAGVVQRLRYGLFRPGTSRLVLDLLEPARVGRQFVLRPEDGKPWRLVIDLTPASRSDFVAAMQPRRRLAPAAGASTSAAAPQTAVLPPPGRPRPKPVPPNVKVIVLDPGHGGVDPGAVTKGGAIEKTIVLAFARELRRRLQARGGYKVVLTRERDIFLPLRERVQIARDSGAALFISLHVNTDKRASTRGFSVYTLSAKGSDQEAEALASKENKADIIAGMDFTEYSEDVADILIDFAQTKTTEFSVQFARDMLTSEVGKSARMLRRPWRSASFAVLKAPDVPSVLLELGYITNQQERRQLQDKAYIGALSEAIARAIDRYFSTARQASRT